MELDSLGVPIRPLAPCPFCGGAAVVRFSLHTGRRLASVGCSDSDCRGSPHARPLVNENEYQAELAAWNARPSVWKRACSAYLQLRIIHK